MQCAEVYWPQHLLQSLFGIRSNIHVATQGDALVTLWNVSDMTEYCELLNAMNGISP